MKRAVIADIHGNLPALEAVLRDARAEGADQYLLLGDYYGELPYPNEIVETVRSLDNACIIQGNKESYLLTLLGQDPSTWTSEQLASIYWNFREITAENRAYLMELPETLVLEAEDGRPIHVAHDPRWFFGPTAIQDLGGVQMAILMKNRPVTHEEYLDHAHRTLTGDAGFLAAAAGRPDGIYLFGHYHTQWHARIGGKLLVNPGSCGGPMNFDARASYSMLSCGDGGWHVEERRVPYDLDRAIKGLKDSDLYQVSKIWSDLTIEQLQSGQQRQMFFLELVARLADESGEARRPYPDALWRRAATEWQRQEAFH